MHNKKLFLIMKGLVQYILEASKTIPTERGKIKFTIWKSPDTKVRWLTDNKSYQKIEYTYEDKEKGISMDFLLGFKDGSWKMWCGKVGAVGYDDDPYCSFETTDFAECIIKALDKVEEMIAAVKEDPNNWVQFYIKL